MKLIIISYHIIILDLSVQESGSHFYISFILLTYHHNNNRRANSGWGTILCCMTVSSIQLNTANCMLLMSFFFINLMS